MAPRPEWLGLLLITKFAFMPPDQQSNQQYYQYYQYGVFWLYNWFQTDNNNISIYFLMNGNIFNYSLASEQYSWECNCRLLLGCSTCSAYATLPNPPGRIYCSITGECEPLFTQ